MVVRTPDTGHSGSVMSVFLHLLRTNKFGRGHEKVENYHFLLLCLSATDFSLFFSSENPTDILGDFKTNYVALHCLVILSPR